MKRKIILLFVTNVLIMTSFFNSFAQSGQKWSTGLNSIFSGEAFGTSNNQPLLIKVNNALALQINPGGGISVNSFSNVGNGIVSYDNSGKLIPTAFPNDATKVFLGNGTWGNVPIPQNYWQFHDPDIYTMTPGNIGFGTDHPLFKVDIVGDVRISENLFVGGGIIITDKVNATSEVNTGKIFATQELKSASLKADSILMDSTKAFYGESNFKGDVKLKYKLDVTGDVQVNGNFRTAGNLTFANNKTIGYLPPSGGNPEILYYATPPQQTFSLCFSPTVPLNQFSGLIQSTGINDGNLNIMTMGYNGMNGIIDMAGITTIEPSNGRGLLINYYCGKDVSVCTGNNGGNVFLTKVGSNGRVGVGTFNPNAKLSVKSDSTLTGLLVETSFDSTANGYGIVSSVGVTGDSTIAIAVKQDTINNFIVYGNGHVLARDVVVKLGHLGDFVFNDDYNLMTIYELENYIKQNHHLPKIPSAKEVKENGMNVGEFQNLVLQKTEEQALYIISLQKQIDDLKKVIEELKK
ncbi:MAG: hypothetical protein HY951_00610 [Bacteroidia bacterium]|nr:hypothetical protein [Bacteroidia bacterium]